jgi:hypothetical protein
VVVSTSLPLQYTFTKGMGILVSASITVPITFVRGCARINAGAKVRARKRNEERISLKYLMSKKTSANLFKKATSMSKRKYNVDIIRFNHYRNISGTIFKISANSCREI